MKSLEVADGNRRLLNWLVCSDFRITGQTDWLTDYLLSPPPPPPPPHAMHGSEGGSAPKVASAFEQIFSASA